jgi:deoxyribodipyrimidine photolyase-related protein
LTASDQKLIRNLVIVLGDQLDETSAAFDGFDNERDTVLMMELAEEATYIPQHKKRLVLFFSAMRHFRQRLEEKGRQVQYVTLDDMENRGDFGGEIARWIKRLRPQKLIVAKPGDYRVEHAIVTAAHASDCTLEVVADRHFICGLEEFQSFASSRRSLLMESFYREMRRKHAILMDGNGPVGGRWNFDRDNRASFGKKGPPAIRAPSSFAPDETTRDVIDTVDRRFPDSPGSTKSFDYPVTSAEAQVALGDFIEVRLEKFGTHQDAMVTGEPYLFHSRLSCVLNLHLLNPRNAIDAAINAQGKGQAPLNSVEGFIRQILGWREFVRGIYWLKMPAYADMNALAADLPVPAFMWTGETDMNCIRQCVTQLIDHAYTHHIQRLMVLGLFAMLLGSRPYDVHRWHISMHVDAIDWVSLPNVLGMSQYGDGGIMGSKPYAASGNYINRMSDYCRRCRYNPNVATGEDACPITSLYWDFLSRNRERISRNNRMAFQIANLDRKGKTELSKIRHQAAVIRANAGSNTFL